MMEILQQLILKFKMILIIYSAVVDIKIGNHVYSKTVRGTSPDSYEAVSIGLDFVPDDGSTLTHSFTDTDISYDKINMVK